MQKEPESIEAVFNVLDKVQGTNDFYDKFLLNLKNEIANSDNLEFRARRIVERFALALQAKVLLETAPDFVAEAFCNSRLSDNNYLNFGTLPIGVEAEKIIERAMVKNQ